MRRQFSKEAAVTTTHQALTDSFGRFHNYLRISLTEKCNLRCVYCMPLEGVQLTPKEKVLTLDERKRLISIFASLGVDKLRFTGGEPTVSKELVPLIEHARNVKGMKSIGITSNGIVLKDKLDKLVGAGMSSVNISLDTMIAQKFASITRRGEKNFVRVLSAIYASAAKGIPVKVNCVIIRGVNDHEIADFVALTREAAVDVRFIELMPFDGNSWSKEKFVSYHEIIDRLRVEHVSTNSAFSKSDSYDDDDDDDDDGDASRTMVFILNSCISICTGSYCMQSTTLLVRKLSLLLLIIL